MLFNSIQFALFLPIVFLLYWFVFDRFISKSKLRLQNVFIVVASYVFYPFFTDTFLSSHGHFVSIGFLVMFNPIIQQKYALF